MSETKQEATDRSPEYVKPVISDYGDLVEVTAAGATGRHVDANFSVGQLASFISSAP